MAEAPAAFEARPRFDGQRPDSVRAPQHRHIAFSRRLAAFPMGTCAQAGAFVSAPTSQPAIRTR